MTEPRRPPPIVTDDTAVFWDAAAQGRMVAQACSDCGRLRHPPRPMCPYCHSLRSEPRELSGKGTLYSYGILHHPQHPAFDYPVLGALVDLDEGIRLVTNLVDVDVAAIRIGMRVEATFVPTSAGAQIPVFTAADSQPRSPQPRSPQPRSPQPRSVGTLSESYDRRSSQLSRGRAAIAGIGSTELSRHAGRTELQLACESIQAALADAHLSPADVDGIVSYTIDPVEETELVRSVGFREIAYSSRVPYGGGGSMGTLLHAASAVASGTAEVVVAYRAIRARSGASRFGAPKTAPSPTSAHSGSTAMQWCMPFGVMTPASWFSLNCTRYMHEYGVTSEDFGRAVVQLRAYAATNPAAWGYGRPITLDDHQASRWIAEPCIRLFDCCQETDGSVALVITSAERAADLTGVPVLISAAGGAGLFEQEIASDHYLPDLSRMEGSVALARRLFDRTGITRDDIDVAMIYDAFSPLLLMQLEALGFCGFGEAKDYVADGNLGMDGKLPTNTNGGLIGEGYIHGLNLVFEAALQLRGTAVNQVPDARTVLVTSSRTGAILTRA
jgi:acetyl-CoA acetyltransferase/uncharacterized OB-fold protein